jgi:tetratricopeptide (TPR) repeat protein
LALALAMPGAAQKRTKIDINAETPEGQMLQQIGQEQDEAQKVALMEEFLAKHGGHDGALWVRGQLASRYAKAPQPDKLIPLVEAILQADPADAEMAHQALKAAEAKNDPDAVIQWAKKTKAAAQAAEKTPKPEDEDEVETWKHTVDFAQQVQKYCEYSVYAQALKTGDAAAKIRLMDAVKEINPQSEYVAQLGPAYFLAYRQTGQNDKAAATALKLEQAGQANEDIYLFLMSHYAQAKDAAKVSEYAEKTVNAVKDKPAPAGVDAAAWEKRKQNIMGIGMQVLGVGYSNQQKWAQADKTLREALPLLEDEQMKAEALFHLGLANYRMGAAAKDPTKLILEAVKFNQQCAAIKSPFQAQAQKNVAAIRTQYRIR